MSFEFQNYFISISMSGSSSSDDEDYRKFNRKAKKNKVPPPPVDFDAINFSKDVAQKLLKQRGFEITEEELGFKKQQNHQKQTNYVPSVDRASFKELQRDFNKIENIPQLCTILKALHQHNEAPPELKVAYGVLRTEFLIRNKQLEDCKRACLELLQKPLEVLERVRVLISLTIAQKDTGQIYEAQINALRVKSYAEQIKMMPNRPTFTVYDQSPEQIYKQIDDVFQSVSFKTQKDLKKTVNLLAIQGNSATGCLGLGDATQSSELSVIGALKNREIKSLACGEHHIIALVSGCSCINPFTIKQCENENCNLGSEVFGWGENFLGQAVMDPSCGNFINQPFNLNKLSGRKVQGVAAYKCTSMAWTEDGQVIQWGVEYPPIQIKDISQLVIGKEFVAVLTKQKQVHLLGCIISQTTSSPMLIFKTITLCQIDKPIQQVSAGDHHVLALDDEGGVHGLGSNQMCQLATPSQQKPFFKKFERLQNVDETFNIQASASSSVFVTTEGELLYCGQITETKTIDYPKTCQMDDECQIIQGAIYNNQLYALNLKGKLYRWEPDKEPKSKLFLSGPIRQFQLCRGIRVVHSTTITGEWSRVELSNEECFTFEDIEITVNLGDQFGPYGFKPLHPVRYNLYVTQDLQTDLKVLTQKSLSISQSKIASQNEFKLYLNHISENHIMKSAVEYDESDKHKIVFQVKEPGAYVVFVFLNEQLCIDCPVTVDVEVGQRAEELKEQQKLEEERQQRRLELERREKQKKEQEEEERKRRQKELEEQERLKQLETKKRAEEALLNHQLKQQEEKRMKEEERLQKKDLLTGGGFDLSKVKPAAKEQKPVISVPRESKLINKTQAQQIKQAIQFEQKLPVQLKKTSLIKQPSQQPQQNQKVVYQEGNHINPQQSSSESASQDSQEVKKKDFSIKTVNKPASQPPNSRLLNPVKPSTKVISTVQTLGKKEPQINQRMLNSQGGDRGFQTQENLFQSVQQEQFRKTDSQIQKIQQEFMQDFRQLKMQEQQKFAR